MCTDELSFYRCVVYMFNLSPHTEDTQVQIQKIWKWWCSQYMKRKSDKCHVGQKKSEFSKVANTKCCH